MDASPVVVTQHHYLGTSMPSGGVHTIKVATRATPLSMRLFNDVFGLLTRLG